MTSPTAPPFLPDYQRRVDEALAGIVPGEDVPPGDVHRAMRYTLLAPSKRVRATVALLAADLFGREPRAMGAALAVECVHAASLILDDLPSMDNAPLRRGRPACHIAFGESTALLASFGLLSLAYGTLAVQYEPPLASRLTTLLAETLGTHGLIAGQADDLAAEHDSVSFERLERIHRLKTGVLFGAAATGGALAAGANVSQVSALAAYAKNLGLAFRNRRRPARRRGGARRDRQADAHGSEEDHLRLVQRDRGRTTAGHRTVRHGTMGTRAVRACGRPPA